MKRFIFVFLSGWVVTGCVMNTPIPRTTGVDFHGELADRCFLLHKEHLTLFSKDEALQTLYDLFDTVVIREITYMETVIVDFIKADGSERSKMTCNYSNQADDIISISWGEGSSMKRKFRNFPEFASIRMELKNRSLHFLEENHKVPNELYYPMGKIMRNAIITFY